MTSSGKNANLFSPESARLSSSFPYLLSAQYLLAGVGAVIGVLSSAFATSFLREIPPRDEIVVPNDDGNGGGDCPGRRRRGSRSPMEANTIVVVDEERRAELEQLKEGQK